MSKKIQLSVPKPCHEDWAKMTPVEKGKFCGSCQKQVVDFSTMSDRQVAEFFKKPSTGSVCGRFMTDQLDRDISIPKKRIPFIKYFFQILIPALFITKVSAQKIGKVAVRPVVKVDTVPPRETMGIVARPIEDSRLISGVIQNDSGEPLKYASVQVKGTNTGVAADSTGKFTLKVKTGDVLVVSYAEYAAKEFTINNGKYYIVRLQPLTLKGEVVTVTAGMVICTRPSKKPVPELIPITTETNSRNFKIFPNPLRAGEQLTIDYKRLPQGSFQMQWLDQSGQLIHEQPFIVESKSGSYRTTVPVIIAGSYFLVLTEKKTGKRFTEKVIIQ